jgi:hypothetical protein
MLDQRMKERIVAEETAKFIDSMFGRFDLSGSPDLNNPPAEEKFELQDRHGYGSCVAVSLLRSSRSCLPLSLSLAGSLSKKLMHDATVLHSDLIPQFPCDSELISVEALSTERFRLLWCSGCGTEFTFNPDSEWETVVYPGMKSGLET